LVCFILNTCLTEQVLCSLKFGIIFQHDCDKDEGFASVPCGTLRWLSGSSLAVDSDSGVLETLKPFHNY
jgi:hypothetical protein